MLKGQTDVKGTRPGFVPGSPPAAWQRPAQQALIAQAWAAPHPGHEVVRL